MRKQFLLFLLLLVWLLPRAEAVGRSVSVECEGGVENHHSPVDDLALQSQQKTFKMLGVIDEAGAVVNGAGSVDQSLTGALKSSYNKLITSGLNAVEEVNVIKLFNAENKLVAEIVNNKLIFKYSGYGGDIAMVEGKSTAVYGRFNDQIN